MKTAAVPSERKTPAAETKICCAVLEIRDTMPKIVNTICMTNSIEMQETNIAIKKTATDTGEINKYGNIN